MKTFGTILLSILISCVIIGGGVYYYVNQKSITDRDEMLSRMEDIYKKVSKDSEKNKNSNIE